MLAPRALDADPRTQGRVGLARVHRVDAADRAVMSRAHDDPAVSRTADGAATSPMGPGARPAVPLRRLLVFFATVYAVQGLAEPKAGLATQPLFFLLKDEMRLSAAETATFLALIGFAWNVKPLYGLVSDLVPLFGYRRRSYLLVTTAMAALGWLALGLLPAYPWGLTLAILGLTGLGLAFTDVLCDAVMVEEGKARGLTARFQSIQWTAIYGASLLAGVAGGYLSAHVSYSRTFLLVALFPALSFAASAWAVHEPRTRFDRATVKETLAALREGARSGPLWRAAAFIFLWNFTPSFGVPLEYHMVDVLGITKIQLGVLSSLGSGAAMLGALVFGRYATRLAPKPLLNLAILIGVAGTLAYYGLVGVVVGGRADGTRRASSPRSRSWPRSTWRRGRSRGAPRGRSSPRSCRSTTSARRGPPGSADTSTTWSGSTGSSRSAPRRWRRAGSSCPGSGSPTSDAAPA